MRTFSVFLAILTLRALGVAAAEPVKHITVPFKTHSMSPMSAEGVYTMDIEDTTHGKLTLTMRVTSVSETGFTVSAEGTDYAVTYPLPAEARGSVVLATKKRMLGEPLDAAKAEALLRYLIKIRYFTYAAQELTAHEEALAAVRDELRAAIAEGRARLFLEYARDLARLGRFEDAGRMLTQAHTVLAESGGESWAPKLAGIQEDAKKLQAHVTGEAQAEGEWEAAVRRIREALRGTEGDDAGLVARLLPDLDGPLPGARRRAILKDLRADAGGALNFTQALDALKEFSFAVRYGAHLERKELAQLDEFFACEHAIDGYFHAAGEAQAAPLLEQALAFRGLTDRVFEALVRYGQRAPAPPAPDAGRSPQGPFALEAPREDELEIRTRYKVVLPSNYHPSKRFPLLLALHGMNGDADAALQYWAEPATRRGWIVAAPECVIGRGKGYGSLPEERRIGLRCVADGLRRFGVDPARVYVAGHSMGGHMAWDLALTYPDRFAAAAPFIGCVNGVSANYIANLKLVPVYCVSGETDAQITEVNRRVYHETQTQKLPLIHVEYRGRGHEGFSEEFPAVLDWMETKARPRAPAEVDFVSFDLETNRVHWVEMRESAAAKPDLRADPLGNLQTAFRPKGIARVHAKVGKDNALEITAYNTQAVRVYLAADLFDLTKRMLRLTVNRRTAQIPFQPSRKRLLEIARASGDRERLYWAVVDVPVR